MKGDFKTLFRRFCLESSILGLKYFYLYPDLLSRCFWALAMALIFYMACLLTYLLHNRFLEMPTRIAIENQYEPVKNLTFPAITICSPNQITISAMKHFNKTLVDGNRTLDLNSILPQLLGFYELAGDSNQEDLVNLQNLITVNRYTSLEVMGMMPQSCDDFLKLCFLKGKRYSKCKDLFYPILTKHGMCCIFNSIYHYKSKRRNERIPDFKPKTTTNTGFMESLVVVADYNPDDALAGTILNAGAVRVMFTDWTEFPADDESNLVRPNSESFHLIHPTYTYCSEDVIALPSWSRKCYFEDEYRLSHFRKYHNSDCDLLCHVTELERLCGCTTLYVPNVRLSHVCNVTSINCITQAKMQMNKWYRTEQCDCPRDCVSFRYRVELITGNLDGLSHMMLGHLSMEKKYRTRYSTLKSSTSSQQADPQNQDMPGETWTVENTRLKWSYPMSQFISNDGKPELSSQMPQCYSSRIQINERAVFFVISSDIVFNKTSSIMYFFFPNTAYVKQKQETVMSLISLSSNLGGVFGLCLGCSAISVMEIFFYLYWAAKNNIMKRLHNVCRNKVDLSTMG